jgi:hypothetical protein
MAIWNILWTFGIIHGYLVLFVVFCYIFPNLVCLDQDKSGNPGWRSWADKFFILFAAKKNLAVVNYGNGLTIGQ